jgi:hypothetical protein
LVNNAYSKVNANEEKITTTRAAEEVLVEESGLITTITDFQSEEDLNAAEEEILEEEAAVEVAAEVVRVVRVSTAANLGTYQDTALSRDKEIREEVEVEVISKIEEVEDLVDLEEDMAVEKAEGDVANDDSQMKTERLKEILKITRIDGLDRVLFQYARYSHIIQIIINLMIQTNDTKFENAQTPACYFCLSIIHSHTQHLQFSADQICLRCFHLPRLK